MNPDQVIVPGRQVGHLRIGEDADAARRQMGRAPDTGDAAMMKAWATWFSGDAAPAAGAFPHAVDMFFVPRGSDLSRKVVEQIRVTSPFFRIGEGMSVGSTLGQICRAYPAIRRVAAYLPAPSVGRTTLYDDPHDGITFEVAGGRDGADAAAKCVAILVHPPSRSYPAYLPVTGYVRYVVVPYAHRKGWL